MKYDLLIKNGTVVTSGETYPADIGIADGKIAAILAPGGKNEAAKEVDAGGKYVLPGLIDIHSHFREPGYPKRDDFRHGSRTGAIGGITTVFDMPNCVPAIDSKEHFELKRNLVEGNSSVDYGFWGTITGNDLSHIEELAECGAIGYKIFVGQTFGAIPSPAEGALFEAFKRIRETGLRIGVHAEDRGFVEYFEEEFKKQGRIDYMDFDYARGNTSEALAIARMAVMSHMAGNKMHIVHMSTKEGKAIVKAARGLGVDITCETCPQYTILTKEDFYKYGQIIKIHPPVRTTEDCDSMMAGLRDGEIDILSSDSAAHEKDEKFKTRSIWDVPAGIHFNEHYASIMLNEINKGRLTLGQFVRVSSENPARIFGMYPKKGAVMVGSDADFTIVDMEKEIVVDQTKTHYKQDFTFFDGFQFTGAAVCTILRGTVTAMDGEPTDQCVGQFIDSNKLKK